jgi:hypothetical protein
MTVGCVYWHFDALAAYIKLTSPFGSGDEEEESAPASFGGGEVRKHSSGFAFAGAAQKADARFAKGITVHGGIEAVRQKDPLLADLLTSDLVKGD